MNLAHLSIQLEMDYADKNRAIKGYTTRIKTVNLNQLLITTCACLILLEFDCSK